MSEPTTEDVREILHDAETASASMLGDDGSESDQPDVLEAAEQASAFLESADPSEILEAVGLETLPDGSEPDSIPEAIAQGDPERVDTLQQLFHLANLAEADHEGLETVADALRHSREEPQEEEMSTDDQADTDEPADDDEADESEIGEQLRDAFQSTVTDVSDDLEGLTQRLEEATAGVVDGEDEEADEATDEVEETDEEGAEKEGAEGDEDDDGLLDPGLGSDDGDSGGKDRERLSTVAPSPSERADMNVSTNYSTMPDSK
ncbi:hypothetical protein [Natronorubrum daqingense]|uniref:Uncharacterized protein n=1 Tax=Natronorubrum daqingense TaxID=588898 RepID=A0A1N6Y7F8_9EURY|nr:hypothetical protein [Natronorubrum daqingense]APX95752.1 hypothetical protein BB347_03495 [Natronorubrum daqingense]SIR10508.1 hypothetical protein SAMN05421809_0344 [Natronorubrum daqingense]